MANPDADKRTTSPPVGETKPPEVKTPVPASTSRRVSRLKENRTSAYRYRPSLPKTGSHPLSKLHDSR